MCTKADNSCREEKLGCQGCYFRRKSTKYQTLRACIEKAIIGRVTMVITTDDMSSYFYDLENIHYDSLQTIQYIVRENKIEVIKDNRLRVIIYEIKK